MQCTVNLCRGINSERRLSVQSASPLAAPSHTYHHCSFNLAPQDVVTSPTQHTLSRARQPSIEMPPLSAPTSPVACSSDPRPASMGCNRVVRGRHRERERGRHGTRAQHEVRRTQAPRVLPRARRSPVRALTRRPSSHAPPKAHAPPSVPRSLAWHSVTFCAAAGGSGRPLRVTARSISCAISTMLGPTPSSAWWGMGLG